jgi:cytoskeletal protein CcmA (bactofilin family)
MKYSLSIGKTSIIALFALIIVVAPVGVKAIVKQSDNLVYVGPEEVIDDNLVVFADSKVEIEGTIKGDLIVATRIVNIKGAVEGDVIVTAGDIKITGPVGGDVRAAGGTIIIESTIGGNVTVVTGKLILGDSAEVGHSVSAIAGLYEGNGAIVKNLSILTGDASINGPIGRNVKAHVDKDGRLTLLSNARVGGDIYYSSVNQIDSVPGSEVAGIISKIGIPDSPLDNKDLPVKELFLFFKFISLLSALIFGFLLINIFPKAAKDVSERMLKEPVNLILFGFSYFFLIPLVLIVLMITLIGIPIAMVSFALYVIALYLAKIFAGIAIGLVVIRKVTKKEANLFFALIFGIILVYIVSSIPKIGWLIGAGLVWWGLAGLIQWCYTKYKKAV